MMKPRLEVAVCLLAATLAATAGATAPIATPSPPAPAGPPPASFRSRFDLYGDLRLRYELDHDSVLADGVTPRSDRSRLRSRARLGLKGPLAAGLAFDVRAHLGDRDNPQSPHVTLIQNGGAKGTRDQIVLNRLLLKGQRGPVAFIVGRQDLPFWKPHELLWDDDVYLDGVGLTVAKLAAALPVGLRGGVWKLPDGPAQRDFDERSTLTAAQLVVTRDMGARGQLTVAGGLLAVSDKSSVANPTNDDLDYAVGALELQHDFRISGLPATLGASFYHNSSKGPGGDPLRSENDGYVAFAKLGGLDRPGDLQFAYAYAEIEKYAVARFFAQDDWFRFGTATQTRASDYRGHELRLSCLWHPRVSLVARAFFVDTISTRENGDRVRLDVNVKF